MSTKECDVRIGSPRTLCQVVQRNVSDDIISTPYLYCRKELICRCKDEFPSKNLVLNYEMRRRLLDLCNYELGDKQECYVHVTLRDGLNAAIYHAFKGLGRNRLVILP